MESSKVTPGEVIFTIIVVIILSIVVYKHTHKPTPVVPVVPAVIEQAQ